MVLRGNYKSPKGDILGEAYLWRHREWDQCGNGHWTGSVQTLVFASAALRPYPLPYYGLGSQQSCYVFVLSYSDMLRPNSSAKERELFLGYCLRTWICPLSWAWGSTCGFSVSCWRDRCLLSLVSLEMEFSVSLVASCFAHQSITSAWVLMLAVFPSPFTFISSLFHKGVTLDQTSTKTKSFGENLSSLDWVLQVTYFKLVLE